MMFYTLRNRIVKGVLYTFYSVNIAFLILIGLLYLKNYQFTVIKKLKN